MTVTQHTRILAIDPGSVSGAWALLAPGLPPFAGTAQCGDLPTVDRMVNPSELSALLLDLNPQVAIVEQVSAMPKQGVSSSFRFGMGVGIIRGVLGALQIPVVQIHSTRWKKYHRLSSDKEASRALAIRLFPQLSRDLSRKKDHGRAEALLIAAHHRDTHARDART